MSDSLVLTSQERGLVEQLTATLADNFQGFDDKLFLKDLPIMAYRLPERLIRYLNDFKYSPAGPGYLIVDTGLVDTEQLKPTPHHWELKTNNVGCETFVMSMCLCATILGDIFGWLTQQDGRIVHDILPIKKYEYDQLGFGSKDELTLHTEDAFHEYRGDYLVMMCMRNPDGVPTTLSRPDYSQLTPAQLDVLFEKKYTIRPDNSHKLEASSEERTHALQQSQDQRLLDSYQAVKSCEQAPNKVAVLFGDKKRPFLRLDPYFMEDPEDSVASEALQRLIELIDAAVIDVALSPGQILVVDNYEVVHGRRPFTALFNGTDRWYKRLNVIRDIRRCQSVLESRDSRVVC